MCLPAFDNVQVFVQERDGHGMALVTVDAGVDWWNQFWSGNDPPVSGTMGMTMWTPEQLLFRVGSGPPPTLDECE